MSILIDIITPKFTKTNGIWCRVLEDLSINVHNTQNRTSLTGDNVAREYLIKLPSSWTTYASNIEQYKSLFELFFQYKKNPLGRCFSWSHTNIDYFNSVAILCYLRLVFVTENVSNVQQLHLNINKIVAIPLGIKLSVDISEHILN